MHLATIALGISALATATTMAGTLPYLAPRSHGAAVTNEETRHLAAPSPSSGAEEPRTPQPIRAVEEARPPQPITRTNSSGASSERGKEVEGLGWPLRAAGMTDEHGRLLEEPHMLRPVRGKEAEGLGWPLRAAGMTDEHGRLLKKPHMLRPVRLPESTDQEPPTTTTTTTPSRGHISQHPAGTANGDSLVSGEASRSIDDGPMQSAGLLGPGPRAGPRADTRAGTARAGATRAGRTRRGHRQPRF